MQILKLTQKWNTTTKPFERVPLRKGLWEHEPDEVLDANDDRDEYGKMNYRDMVSNAG